jgi:hypothetical protein
MTNEKRRLYYKVKPFIPRVVQVLMRKKLVQRQRIEYANEWPVYPGSEKAPDGWTGWPDGKQFAVVLTHDVETEIGVRRCLALAAMETARGFRSSFNFVPKRYSVPPVLLQELREAGFEIGVHGLHHDGKLFESFETFSQRAEEINRYLKEWRAIGFRSPAMHNRLEWMHLLDILYDASTFDTDPFEPQPSGVGTIFPFIVRNAESGTDFIELPYTLVQDFTLFVLMEELGPTVWKKKLDWIAQNGGMVLLNTHPDYMNFSGRHMRLEEFPVTFYDEFLEYLNERYGGQFYHALPGELATFWKVNFGMKIQEGTPG